jgi:hypothetical protein
MMVLGLCAVGVALAGCQADEVEYVDKQGNVLAVDEEGKPVRPQASPARAPSVVTSSQPVPVADPDGPPTGALPDPTALPERAPRSGSPSMAPRPVAPKPKKIDSSSALDGPPAG